MGCAQPDKGHLRRVRPEPEPEPEPEPGAEPEPEPQATGSAVTVLFSRPSRTSTLSI